MLWRVRTTVGDRPGVLAEIAVACGRAHVNIVGMQVFTTGPGVTDEFVVGAPEGWSDLRVAQLFESAGGSQVAVTRVSDVSAADATTRWLEGVRQVLEDDRDVEVVLRELLETEPPDVADYVGHDELDLKRRGGSILQIRRAVPFTPVEEARAQALLSLVSDAAAVKLPGAMCVCVGASNIVGKPVAVLLMRAEATVVSPSSQHPEPLVREAGLADIEAVAALHVRCSLETIYHRYQVPLQMPMTTRMARRLVVPAAGQALVVEVGADVVGHGVLELVDETWTFQLLIEDAWQGRGLGTVLLKNAARRAKGQGAARLTFVTAGSNDNLLRAVGNAGFVARVERHDGNIHITVPLTAV